MDFMAQVQNYMMSQQYESLLKKGQLQGTVLVDDASAALGPPGCKLAIKIKYECPTVFRGHALCSRWKAAGTDGKF